MKKQLLICCDSKLPETVDTADLSKPLYRRDIFYSGNLIHVEGFKSQPDVSKAEYTRSVTAIPVDDEPLQTYTICGCIPVSKTVYNTVKQVSRWKNSFSAKRVREGVRQMWRVLNFSTPLPLIVYWVFFHQNHKNQFWLTQVASRVKV